MPVIVSKQPDFRVISADVHCIVTLGVELSWVALFLSALAMLATGIAWYKRRTPLPSLPSTDIELEKNEAVVEVMAVIEDKDPRLH